MPKSETETEDLSFSISVFLPPDLSPGVPSFCTGEQWGVEGERPEQQEDTWERGGVPSALLLPQELVGAPNPSATASAAHRDLLDMQALRPRQGCHASAL